ncbi:PstS family phosphate ABC transporter substrate-binding protein [Sandaracinomonas limnophila]|nr:substrate-binding domain-containing protein [Sandaracinomonas limnophila]
MKMNMVPTPMKNNLLILVACFLILSCSKSEKKQFDDTPIKGEISLGVDDSFSNLMNAEKTAFENNAHYAKIKLNIQPENQAVADLLNDKVRGIIITRDLTEKEKETFVRENISYRSFRFAADGIACITHKSNTDTAWAVEDLKNQLLGTGSKQIELVVDKNNSSNVKFLVDYFKIPGNATLRVREVGDNPKVISYVKSHSNAVGLIGSNWISDGDNPTSLGFIRSVNVISFAKEKGLSKNEYYQPFGYNIALKKYPFRREAKIVLKEAHLGLGTGFVNYVCGDMGQLIVLKAGLIPLTRPVTIRTFEINKK